MPPKSRICFAAAAWLGRVWGQAPAWFDRSAVSGIWKAPFGLVVSVGAAWVLSPLLLGGKRPPEASPTSSEQT